jgi:hypothetical protein
MLKLREYIASFAFGIKAAQNPHAEFLETNALGKHYIVENSGQIPSQKAFMIGLSFDSWYGLRFALEYPERFAPCPDKRLG